MQWQSIFYGALLLVVVGVSAFLAGRRAGRRDPRQQQRGALPATPDRLAVFAQLDEGVLLLDAAQRILDANPAAAAIFGATPAALIGQPLARFLPDYPGCDAGAPPPAKIELSLRDPAGTARRYEVRCLPVNPGAADQASALLLLQDHTVCQRARRAEADHRAFLAALGEVAAMLNSSLSLNDVFASVLENVRKVIQAPYDAANVMLIEDGVARVVCNRRYADHVPDDAYVYGLRFPLAETRSFREVYETGEPLCIPDISEFPGWVSAPTDEWVQAVAVAPVKLDDAVIGFLNLQATTTDAFTPLHLQRLRSFADQAATAIANAQLFEAVQEKARELEARNQELDAYGHTIAHDLRAPLNLIIGFADVAQMDPAALSPETDEYLTYIKDAAYKMNDMISSLLMLATLRDTEQVLHAVAMTPVVEAAAQHYRERARRRGIRLCIDPDLPPALGYAPWLEEVFANLIGNAVKYIGEDNPDPVIHIRGGWDGDRPRYEVVDNGLGITPEAQAQLFKQFARFHEYEAEGFGLGLSIVMRILKRLDGRIGVESTPGEPGAPDTPASGSTFWFTLPAAPVEELAPARQRV